MSDKFFIKHDNIALLVNTMAVRLSEWSGSLSEIMASFDSFSASEGFTGGSANIAKEYCATYYGSSGISSLPILLSESSVAISEALLLYEKTFLDYDTVDKFSISEDKIDYIIQDAGVEAIGDFETIHENAINIINSISDIVELPKPDDTYYIQDSEDIVSQLEEVKEDIYELEAAELVIIEELNEQIDSLLALVESYSNKTKRATSLVSSDEYLQFTLVFGPVLNKLNGFLIVFAAVKRFNLPGQRFDTSDLQRRLYFGGISHGICRIHIQNTFAILCGFRPFSITEKHERSPQ